MTFMPEWTGEHQLALFWQSCVLGAALGFLFDFFNIPSKTRRRRRLTVFLCDVLFFAVAAMVTFFFSLAVMDGRMHPLLFCGSFLGMAVQHLVIGRLFSRMLYCVGRFVCIVFRRLLGWLRVPFDRVFSAFSRLFSSIRTKIRSNAKKMQKKSDFFQKTS